jgi:hypothetical protein
MPKLKALYTIDHDGKSYAPGKVLEVDDDQAAALLAVGAAELFSSKKAQAEADKAAADTDKAAP